MHKIWQVLPHKITTYPTHILEGLPKLSSRHLVNPPAQRNVLIHLFWEASHYDWSRVDIVQIAMDILSVPSYLRFFSMTTDGTCMETLFNPSFDMLRAGSAFILGTVSTYQINKHRRDWFFSGQQLHNIWPRAERLEITYLAPRFSYPGFEFEQLLQYSKSFLNGNMRSWILSEVLGKSPVLRQY